MDQKEIDFILESSFVPEGSEEGIPNEFRT